MVVLFPGGSRKRGNDLVATEWDRIMTITFQIDVLTNSDDPSIMGV